jgi:hypothetical protein
MAQGVIFGHAAKITDSSDDIGKKDRFCTAEFGDRLTEL